MSCLPPRSLNRNKLTVQETYANSPAVKRLLSLLLLIGAISGLFAQEVAFARAMPFATVEQSSASVQMSDECAEMMDLADQQPDKPCDGMTLECMAKMGCAVPLVLIPRLATGEAFEYRALAPPAATVASLVGRSLIPEPRPPASLG